MTHTYCLPGMLARTVHAWSRAACLACVARWKAMAPNCSSVSHGSARLNSDRKLLYRTLVTCEMNGLHFHHAASMPPLEGSCSSCHRARATQYTCVPRHVSRSRLHLSLVQGMSREVSSKSLQHDSGTARCSSTQGTQSGGCALCRCTHADKPRRGIPTQAVSRVIVRSHELEIKPTPSREAVWATAHRPRT